MALHVMMNMTDTTGDLEVAVMKGGGLGAGLLIRIMKDLIVPEDELRDHTVAGAVHIMADSIAGSDHSPDRTLDHDPNPSQGKIGKSSDVLDPDLSPDPKQMANTKQIENPEKKSVKDQSLSLTQNRDHGQNQDRGLGTVTNPVAINLATVNSFIHRNVCFFFSPPPLLNVLQS